MYTTILSFLDIPRIGMPSSPLGLEYDLIAVAFVCRAPYDRLTVLALSVQNFRPDILNLLAETLPSLQKLRIMAVKIFQEEIYAETCVYTEGKNLTSLRISRYSLIAVAWSLMLYLADHCIPSILGQSEKSMGGQFGRIVIAAQPSRSTSFAIC